MLGSAWVLSFLCSLPQVGTVLCLLLFHHHHHHRHHHHHLVLVLVVLVVLLLRRPSIVLRRLAFLLASMDECVCLQQVLFGSPELFCKCGSLWPMLPCAGGRIAERALWFVDLSLTDSRLCV